MLLGEKFLLGLMPRRPQLAKAIGGRSACCARPTANPHAARMPGHMPVPTATRDSQPQFMPPASLCPHINSSSLGVQSLGRSEGMAASPGTAPSSVCQDEPQSGAQECLRLKRDFRSHLTQYLSPAGLTLAASQTGQPLSPLPLCQGFPQSSSRWLR